MSDDINKENLEDNLPMVNYIMLHRIYDMMTIIANHFGRAAGQGTGACTGNGQNCAGRQKKAAIFRSRYRSRDLFELPAQQL